MDVGSGVAGFIAVLQLVLVVTLIVLFIRMSFDVKAIRIMLENQGWFSGVACDRCGMPIPAGAAVCGHCGRDLETGQPRATHPGT